MNRAEQKERDEEYIRELKLRTKCFNCKRKDHWWIDCPDPIKPNLQRGGGKEQSF